MLIESHILPPTSDYPLFIVAKRYWVPEFEKNVTNPSAETLIVLHSTSFHKETWEPALEDLFALASQPGSTTVIREAWTIDCPNHGESGQRNHRTLTEPGFQDCLFSCERYAHAVHRFLSAGLNHGARVDFRSRNLVGIGHSLGGNAILMLQQIQPVFTFSTLVIVEPMLSAVGRHHIRALRDKLVGRAKKRTKLWPTLEEANQDYNDLRRRGAKWDPRVLDRFLHHALHWKPEAGGFGLSCSPEQEVAMYLDEEGPTKPVEVLNKVCHRIPVHLILGEIPDMIPSHVHQALTDPKSGRRFASVTIQKNVGHLVRL
ncbi:Alpha/beta hydrolase fold-1 [Flammula alnicola]|nr:Alpha/beta hydrolase fold-1 [Flammula alnicola]